MNGKHVRLRLRDKDDLDFFFEFWNNLDCYGEFEEVQPQISHTEAQRRIENPSTSDPIQWKWFVIEKNDGTKIGFILHYTSQPSGNANVGYALTPKYHGKGYGTEALQIMIDYLFLTRNIRRVQANTDVRNKASQRILEKTGFKQEDIARKSSFARGEHTDNCQYAILREEWKKPRILTKTARA